MISESGNNSSCLELQNANLQAGNIQDSQLIQQVHSRIHESTLCNHTSQHDSAHSSKMVYPKKKTKRRVKFANTSQVFVFTPQKHTSEMSYSEDERKMFLRDALTSARTIDTMLRASHTSILQQSKAIAEQAIGIEHLLYRGELLKQVSRQRRDHKASIMAEQHLQASLGVNDPLRLAVVSSAFSMHNTRKALSRAARVEILNRME